VLRQQLADLGSGLGVALPQPLEDQILLGVMIEVRVGQAVVDHSLHDVVVGPRAPVEDVELAFEGAEQPGHVGVFPA
jgi:hypothetical protein